MRHRAFTLIELLVVIAILTLLLALSSPVLTASRRQAQAAACRANIHQLLLYLQHYDSEHQSLPYGLDMIRKDRPPGGYVGNMTYDLPGWWWFHSAGAVRDKSREGERLLQCPSKRLNDPRLSGDLLCGNYGVNRSLCKSNWTSRSCYAPFMGAPLSLGGLRCPGSTLLIVDSGFTLTCWWQASTEPPIALGDSAIEDTAYIPGLEINKDRVLRQGQSGDAVGGRHPHQTVNIGFADGHVDNKHANKLLVAGTEDEGYTNRLLWQGQ